MWSFISLPSAAITKILAKLDAEEGRMEIKEYVFLEEELIPKAYITNWTRIKKIIKALGVI